MARGGANTPGPARAQKLLLQDLLLRRSRPWFIPCILLLQMLGTVPVTQHKPDEYLLNGGADETT